MEESVKQWLFDPTIGKLVATVIGILVIIALVRFFQRSVARYIPDSDTRYRVRKFIAFFGYLGAVLYLAIVFKERLGGLTVALGVAGAGVAFALQEVIASVAGWAAVSLGGFYRPGDRIQLGGIKGDVIDIGILRTTLMEIGQWVQADQYNGRIVRVANSFVFKEPVFNYSADFPFLWDEIVVPVKYGSDFRQARQLLESILDRVVGDYSRQALSAWKDVVQKYRIEDARVEPTVTLIANDNWMEFTLRYVVDYRRRRATKDILFSQVLDEFEKSEGRVALGTTSFQLLEAPPLDVRVRQGPAEPGS